VRCSGFFEMLCHVSWSSSDCLQPVCGESNVDLLDLDDAVFLLISWCDKYIRVARVVAKSEPPERGTLVQCPSCSTLTQTGRM
jgi:hypothetical protein